MHDAVLDEVRELQSRPLDPVYPGVLFGALPVKNPRRRIGQEQGELCGTGRTPSGFGSNRAKAPKFWLKVINEMKTRGVNDILIAVVDGLKGFPEAVTSVYPQTVVQSCIVHLIRNSL